MNLPNFNFMNHPSSKGDSFTVPGVSSNIYIYINIGVEGLRVTGLGLGVGVRGEEITDSFTVPGVSSNIH
jgi:hypothetical protein